MDDFLVNLLIQLQRSQRSASSLPGRFCGFAPLGFDPFHFPAEADQTFGICVTANAFTLWIHFVGHGGLFGRTYLKRGRSQQKEDHPHVQDLQFDSPMRVR